MANEAKRLTSKGSDDSDIANARLIRRGPARSARLSLRTLREGARLTQEQVSKKSGLAQSEISKLEAASSLDDRMVSTVRRYLAAIGADLELVAASKFGHRIAVAGAPSTGHAVADESSPFSRFQEHIAAAKAVLEEVEPSQPGVNRDRGGQLLQETLEVVVSAAGIRWKEPLLEHLNVDVAKRMYALPAGLLNMADRAFRNENRNDSDELAGDIRTLLKAIALSWGLADKGALRKPTAKGKRDAPIRWAARYLGERPLTFTERKKCLIEQLRKHFALDPDLKKLFAQEPQSRSGPQLLVDATHPDPRRRAANITVSQALMNGCVKAENGFPLELQSKLEKRIERDGLPDNVEDLVALLLRLAGNRDPLNTLHKQQRRRERAVV